MGDRSSLTSAWSPSPAPALLLACWTMIYEAILHAAYRLRTVSPAAPTVAAASAPPRFRGCLIRHIFLPSLDRWYLCRLLEQAQGEHGSAAELVVECAA